MTSEHDETHDFVILFDIIQKTTDLAVGAANSTINSGYTSISFTKPALVYLGCQEHRSMHITQALKTNDRSPQSKGD